MVLSEITQGYDIKINIGCMALTHEYSLMLICWSTWLVPFEVSLIYLMMYY
jgi:hypothetical protein